MLVVLVLEAAVEEVGFDLQDAVNAEGVASEDLGQGHVAVLRLPDGGRGVDGADAPFDDL